MMLQIKFGCVWPADLRDIYESVDGRTPARPVYHKLTSGEIKRKERKKRTSMNVPLISPVDVKILIVILTLLFLVKSYQIASVA